MGYGLSIWDTVYRFGYLPYGYGHPGYRYGVWANDMGDDSIDLVILEIDMEYLATLPCFSRSRRHSSHIFINARIAVRILRPGRCCPPGHRRALQGGHVPIIGGSGAHCMGVRCPLYGGQVPIVWGPGAHYMGVRCPLWGGQVPITGGQVPIVNPRSWYCLASHDVVSDIWHAHWPPCHDTHCEPSFLELNGIL